MMAQASPNPNDEEPRLPDPSLTLSPVADEPEPPHLEVYRSALRRYEPTRLGEVLESLGLVDRPTKPTAWAEALADRLSAPGEVARRVADLEDAPRLALGLFALSEAPGWPVAGLAGALRALGTEPAGAILPLLGRGLLALRVGPEASGPTDPTRLPEGDGALTAELLIHPSVPAAIRTALPPGPAPRSSGEVRQVRESDGLEPILRLAALWQRVAEAPLRRTQQGPLYKRDRDRLEDDLTLAGPIADALEPLPDMAPLWLALARGVGLISNEPQSDRVVAAPAEFWADNAIHLPQMVAVRWLALRTWHEQAGIQEEGTTAPLTLPFLRPAVLLWLARLPEGAWTTLDDLAEHLDGLWPGWDRLTLSGGSVPAESPARDRIAVLRALLLGPAYQLGLIRAAEEVSSRKSAVQLSAAGRYALALGPYPPPRPAFESFLFVQPNFEVIAYRQGLNPPLIGQLSRFARWSQVGAALELKLTPESVYRGLETGLTPDQILSRLGRHSSRPLPAGVAEAVRTWAGRREQVTYYSAATLIEFPSTDQLEAALAAWPRDGRELPVRAAARLLLVEDSRSIPGDLFRHTAARDYRHPPEVCVEVEPDGVTLTLDPARSDLFVDAELARFADEVLRGPAAATLGPPRRRFQVSAASLARALEDGLTPSTLTRWFTERTGMSLPPALHLLLHAAGPRPDPLTTTQPLILHAPSAELLDGLLQHPATRPHLGSRLGPTAVVVPNLGREPLRQALAGLGLSLSAEPNPTDKGSVI